MTKDELKIERRRAKGRRSYHKNKARIREKLRERHNLWRSLAENKAKTAAAAKRYRDANREVMRAKRKAYSVANSKKLRLYSKLRYEMKRDMILAQKKQYALNNPEKIKAKSQRTILVHYERLAEEDEVALLRLSMTKKAGAGMFLHM